jgi:signal transduction histidine kinase
MGGWKLYTVILRYMSGRQRAEEARLRALDLEEQNRRALDASTGKRYGGTGLGLALTKRLVEAQGGRVGVRSTPGEGSLFFAVMPRRTGAVPAEGVGADWR